MTSVKNSLLPPSLVSNLQDVLMNRNGREDAGGSKLEEGTEGCVGTSEEREYQEGKPIVLVTNGDGIGSPGLTELVHALVRSGQYVVHVCAPESDKSASGHSVTLRETVSVSSVEIHGASAYEVSGTPVDCISLALSGSLFSWSKPAMVISGINKGSSCGNHIFYSGAVAGAREALLCGVPSLSISLNWNKDESQESEFKEAVDVCLPLINAAIRDIEKGIFPKRCFFNVEVPSTPAANKGFKITRHSQYRSVLSWQAVSSSRYPAGHFMSKQQSLGIQLAQLGRDASAAAAVRRLNAQRKTVEIESVAEHGKPEPQQGTARKYYRLEFTEKDQEAADEDLDFRAVENGFISVTPLDLLVQCETEMYNSASDWLAAALAPSDVQTS
ncbi:5'-nucleotidase [Nymphaea thermarum]|nr:5'-nucleotidase [Nymphaea thermarum]